MSSSLLAFPGSPNVVASALSAPPLLEFLGETVAIALSGTSTGGAYALIDVLTPEGGGSPTLHAHAGAETIVVLTGTYKLIRRVRGAVVTAPAPPGTVVFIPKDTPHGYTNVGRGPGRLLRVVDAAGQMDGFFRAVGRPVSHPLEPVDAFPDVARYLQALATFSVSFWASDVEPPT